MKDISQVRVCVVDTGLYLNFARTMAAKCDLVLYCNPDQRTWPSIAQSSIGDGFQEIHVVRDFWSHLNDIDIFCYPDVGRGAEQQYLRSIGKPVWGSGRGEDLELRRESFLKILGQVGLDVPEYEICHGLSELREFLNDKEDYYIKISRYRGDMETHHYRNLKTDQGWLEGLAVRFGPLQELMNFLALPAIDADIEIGRDTYNILGRWPGIMLSGCEGKDRSYLSAVTNRSEMPREIQAVMDAFSPVLEERDYRGQWSSEIRVQGDHFYFIDPTCRGGMPSSGTQQKIWSNFAEIVWAGANGELLDPEPLGKFSIETMITIKEFEGEWATLELDKDLEGSAQMNTCCYVDGVYAFPKREHGDNDLGWLVSIGDSVEEVLQKQKDAADLLPDGFSADVESLATVLKDVDKARDPGATFTHEELPEPAEVL